MAAVSEVVWRPDRATVEHANATRLVRRAGVADFAELVRRSQEDPAWFWPLAIEDMGLEFSTPWQQVMDESGGPEWTTWFTGGRVNLVERPVMPEEIGRSLRDLASGGLGLRIYRHGEVCGLWDPGSSALQKGDLVVEIQPNDASKRQAGD